MVKHWLILVKHVKMFSCKILSVFLMSNRSMSVIFMNLNSILIVWYPILQKDKRQLSCSGVSINLYKAHIHRSLSSDKVREIGISVWWDILIRSSWKKRLCLRLLFYRYHNLTWQLKQLENLNMAHHYIPILA